MFCQVLSRRLPIPRLPSYDVRSPAPQSSFATSPEKVLDQRSYPLPDDHAFHSLVAQLFCPVHLFLIDGLLVGSWPISLFFLFF